MSTYYEPGTVLGTEDTAVVHRPSLTFMEFTFQSGRQITNIRQGGVRALKKNKARPGNGE